eukprot:837919-Pleurochrysis_carterae.AAC.1
MPSKCAATNAFVSQAELAATAGEPIVLAVARVRGAAAVGAGDAVGAAPAWDGDGERQTCDLCRRASQWNSPFHANAPAETTRRLSVSRFASRLLALVERRADSTGGGWGDCPRSRRTLKHIPHEQTRSFDDAACARSEHSRGETFSHCFATLSKLFCLLAAQHDHLLSLQVLRALRLRALPRMRG